MRPSVRPSERDWKRADFSDPNIPRAAEREPRDTGSAGHPAGSRAMPRRSRRPPDPIRDAGFTAPPLAGIKRIESAALPSKQDEILAP
jgi:hypothetical protein